MKCENIFCIYQKENHCILKEIELDIMGQCKDCIYVELDLEYLENQKKQQAYK